MSVCTVSVALGRIEAAEPDAPIAVFCCASTKLGLVNAMFSRTVITTNLIDDCDKNLIGIFHKGIRREFIREKIHDAVEKYKGIIL